MYDKHQYSQELECESTVVIHIPISQYKYIVITERDMILHQHYITKRRKSTIYNIRRLGDAHGLQNGDLTSQTKKGQTRDDLQLFYHTSAAGSISTEGSTTFHALGSGMQVQDC